MFARQFRNPKQQQQQQQQQQQWEVLQDHNGRMYYRNGRTGESVWEIPKPTSDGNGNGNGNGHGNGDGNGDATRGHGRMNSTPSFGSDAGDGASAGAGAGAAGLPVGWEALQDPSTERVYYRNTATNEVTWNKPTPTPDMNMSEEENSHSHASPSAASGVPSAPPLPLTLPPGWAALQDQQSGRMYYTNSMTGESSWDIPTAVAIGDTPIAISAEVYDDDGVSVSQQEDGEEFYFDEQQGVWLPMNGDVNSSGNVNSSGDAYRVGNGHQGDTGIGEGAFARGHSCFWLCCDMRKAVMMTNILVMALYIFFVVVIFVGADFMGQVFDKTVNLIGNEVTAEDIKAWLTAAAASTSKKYYEVVYGSTGILLSFMGIIGAYRFNINRKGKFNIFLALVPLLLYLANIVGCVYLLIAVNGAGEELITLISVCALNVVCMYPHIVFMVENKKGIMIPSTYKSVEAHWCCCTHARDKKKDKSEDSNTKKTRKKKHKRSRVSPAQVQEDAGVA